MMPKRQGSALVLVMCVLAVLSIFMVRMQYRTSLLLETVVQREQDIVKQYAAQALLNYAIFMAKHNWKYLVTVTSQGNLSEHYFDWDIGDGKSVLAACLYKSLGSNRLSIIASLDFGAGKTVTIGCELQITSKGLIEITKWS
jgi:hypothetical protein